MPDEVSASSRPQQKFRILSWTLFDFANTSFSVIIVTVIFSRYFTNHVSGGRHWLWGLSVSLSMIVAAALSPPLGAIADFARRRKRFLLYFTLLCVAATALLYFVQAGMILLAMALFILANIGFEGGLVFYDAFLPGLTSPGSYGRVSGYGFAMGYLGALAVLLLVQLVLPDAASAGYLDAVRFTFVIAAAFFLVFSLPLFFFVPEPKREREETVGSAIRIGLSRTTATFRRLFISKEHPAVARFLVAFFLYNDGILTVIAFAAIFAENMLHMSDREIIIFFAVVQTSAILGSIFFGILTDKIGPKKTITITLVLWILISVAAFFTTTVAFFYAVALTAGIAIGSSQSASRSLMAFLTPPEREAEFFGFYDGLCGKASAVVGPYVYGLVADLSNERTAALSIAVFFAAGLLLLRRVDVPARAAAQH